MPVQDILMESHEERISTIESDLKEVLPALGRLDQRMEDLTSTNGWLARIDRKIDLIAAFETRLASLETSRKSVRAGIKWLSGIVATVVAAIVLARFGLHP